MSFGFKVIPRPFVCLAMCSAVLFIWRSGFSVRLFCFGKAKTLCMYGCMYLFAVLVLVCVDVMVMPSA